MGAPEMDSAENPWFLNWINVLIQIALSAVTYPVWGISAILCMNDCWWTTVMSNNLFPPGVTAWNKIRNKGIRAYGDSNYEPTIEYDTFYNDRVDEGTGGAP